MNNTRICLWTGPHHPDYVLSSAFSLRSDTTFIDEPFHAHYLRRTGNEEPLREEILDGMDSRPTEIIANLVEQQSTPILFVKSMTQHIIGVDLSFAENFHHIILIRHPKSVFSSLIPGFQSATLLDTAYHMQHKLFHYLQAKGQSVLVVDTSSLSRNPREIMQLVCQKASIPFEEKMMMWYKQKQALSTLVNLNSTRDINWKNAFTGAFEDLYEQCYTLYVDLLAHSPTPRKLTTV
ncbi:MAG: hypothetical protein AAFY71_26905 [Bacteroidota bacterium]